MGQDFSAARKSCFLQRAAEESRSVEEGKKKAQSLGSAALRYASYDDGSRKRGVSKNVV